MAKQAHPHDAGFFVIAILGSMSKKAVSRLSNKKHYLQVAFNSTLDDARAIISILPPSERIIIEAGTPLIKRYGMDAVRTLSGLWSQRLMFGSLAPNVSGDQSLSGMGLISAIAKLSVEASGQTAAQASEESAQLLFPYVVADMKTMDRGDAEVRMAAQAGASGVIALGSAPTETLNAFVAACDSAGVDAMIDMMNVEFPLTTLRALKKQPKVVILHRGVDEERDNKQKMLPLHEVRRIKGAYDMLIAVAGGDTPREIQSAAFNDADIVVIWKAVYHRNSETLDIVNNFLKTVK